MTYFQIIFCEIARRKWYLRKTIEQNSNIYIIQHLFISCVILLMREITEQIYLQFQNLSSNEQWDVTVQLQESYLHVPHSSSCLKIHWFPKSLSLDAGTLKPMSSMCWINGLPLTLLLIQNNILVRKPGTCILHFDNYTNSLKCYSWINSSLTLCSALLAVFSSQPTQPSPLEGIDTTVAPPPASLLPPGGGLKSLFWLSLT